MKVNIEKRKEVGVSPVIATILMVAITVVLAATLYIMVGNMNNNNNSKLIAANLTYMEDFSDPANGNATFILSMSSPNRANIGDITIKVLDSNGNLVNGANITIIHIVSDDDHLTSGDHIQILYSGHDIHGYQVILSVTGYTGTASGEVPQ